jgi:hypothetical protein
VNGVGYRNDDRSAVHATPLDALVARVNHGDHDQHLAWVLRDIEELRNRPDQRRPETLTSIDAALQAIRTRMRAVESRR